MIKNKKIVTTPKRPEIIPLLLSDL